MELSRLFSTCLPHKVDFIQCRAALAAVYAWT